LLIALEGIDGSGKGTQAQLLLERARQEGMSCELVSFPQYGNNAFAEAVAQYLNGDFGDVYEVPSKLAALLFACDRFATRDKLAEAIGRNDLVVCDRYVASNIAYQAAKLDEHRWGEFIEWVLAVEFGQFSLPRPDLTLWLDVPLAFARKLLRRKGSRAQSSLFTGTGAYMSREADIHERNEAYLERCSMVYAKLASAEETGAWLRVDCVDASGELRNPDDITRELWDAVSAAIAHASAPRD